MIPYILHVSILLAGGYVFYQTLLKNETFFRLNRWILVAGVVLSFLLPLYQVPPSWSLRKAAPAEKVMVYPPILDEPLAGTMPENDAKATSKTEENTEAPTVFYKKNTTENTQKVAQKVATEPPITYQNSIHQLSWQQWLWYAYLIGLAIFAVNFLIQVTILLVNIYKHPSIKDGRFRIIELDKDKPPYSFWNNIFINPTKYDWDTYNQIIEHEKIHIKQRHSLDILLSELAVVLQWFNPFAWWYRKAVENNLEYLTDQEMLQSGTDAKHYQMSLLKISAPEFPLSMTTNYNQSFLKKRIIMMDAKKSSARSTWKYLFLLPLIGLSLISLNTVKPTPHTQSPITVTDGDYKIPTKGNWIGEVNDNLVCLTFRKDEKDRYNRFDECFTTKDFNELPSTPKPFEVKRTAGMLDLNGSFTNGVGKGTFEFTGDKAFKSFLGKEFEEDGIRESTMFLLFLADINQDYINYLKSSKLVTDVEFDDIKTLAVHGVNLSDLKKMNNELAALGYKDVELDDVNQLFIHDVSTDYIKSLSDEVRKDLSLNEVIEAKIHDVNPDYIKKFKAAGYDMDFENIIEFGIHDVDLKYIESLKKAGLGDLTQDQIVQAAIHEVDPNYIKQFENTAYKDMDFDEIIEFAIHEVDIKYLDKLKKVGLTNLTHDQIVQAAIHEVSPQYLKQFENSKYKDMTFNQIIEFAIHEVDMAYVDELKKMGLKDLTHQKIVECAMHDVSPQYLKQFENSKYKDMTFNQIIEFAIHDVDMAYIDELKKAGLKDLTHQQLVEAAIHGIDVNYLKQFANSPYKDMPFNKIIEFVIHDVDVKYIEELEKAGVKDLSHNAIIEFAIHDIDADFIKAARNLGFKDLKMREIIEMGIHDVDADDIQELRDLGYKNITPKEVISAKIHSVNAEFIKDLNDLGFKNISIQKLIELRIHDVHAGFIKEKQAQGKKNLTLDQYIELRVKGWENDKK